MQDEFDAMQAQIRSLQLLVSELLLINQKLRLEVEALRQKWDPGEQAAETQLRRHVALRNGD
jgi:regulator of replication initiation timing